MLVLTACMYLHIFPTPAPPPQTLQTLQAYKVPQFQAQHRIDGHVSEAFTPLASHLLGVGGVRVVRVGCEGGWGEGRL